MHPSQVSKIPNRGMDVVYGTYIGNESCLQFSKYISDIFQVVATAPWDRAMDPCGSRTPI